MCAVPPVISDCDMLTTVINKHPNAIALILILVGLSAGCAFLFIREITRVPLDCTNSYLCLDLRLVLDFKYAILIALVFVLSAVVVSVDAYRAQAPHSEYTLLFSILLLISGIIGFLRFAWI